MTDETLSVGGATVTLDKPAVEAGPAAPAKFDGTITDPRGRSIRLQKPDVLAQFRLIDALGDKTAQNQVYMTMVLPLLFITAIDGVPVAKPSTKADLEALIVRLDEDGVQAVIVGVSENFGAASEGEAKNG